MYAIFLSWKPAVDRYTSIRLYSYTAYVCECNITRCRSTNTGQSISLSICCVLSGYYFVSSPIILHCYTVRICIFTIHMYATFLSWKSAADSVCNLFILVHSLCLPQSYGIVRQYLYVYLNPVVFLCECEEYIRIYEEYVHIRRAYTKSIYTVYCSHTYAV